MRAENSNNNLQVVVNPLSPKASLDYDEKVPTDNGEWIKSSAYPRPYSESREKLQSIRSDFRTLGPLFEKL